jgi:Prokaryotic glutathione synthetase, ATP-grasp domain
MPDARPPRIALATSSDFPEGAGGEGLLTKALIERDLWPEWAVWNDPTVDWPGFDLVVIRSTWDYWRSVDAFRAWVRQPAVATRLVNPPNLVLPNLHKGYLTDLGSLVKPAVGAGGVATVRDAGQADLDALTLAGSPPVDAVVQPYLADVERRGETSVILIGGEATHAVRKLPADGDFRIHEHWGGWAEPIALADDDLAVARAALATLAVVPAYARVDLLYDGGRPLVVELELVEPYLWFEVVPEAAELLARKLLARLDRGR